MSSGKTLLVSTDGQAVFRSHDDGKSWRRIAPDQDLEYDDRVRCLLPDRRDPSTVFAGAETGLFRTTDCGVNWHRVDCALNDYAVWKLVAHEKHPEILYAGTGSPTRAACFRSRDGGETWEKTSLEMPPKCAGVSRPRMLAMAIDPDDPADVWAGVEEGGLFRSCDFGENWTRIDTGWSGSRGDSDVHSITILPGSPRTVVVVVVTGVYRSSDGGESWTRTDARDTWGLYYARVSLRKPLSGNEMFLGIGDGTPGTTSLFFRSSDGGAHWQNAAFPVQPNSCLWALGSNEADPNFLLAGTKFGNLFRSEDGGKSWRKEWREFNEITDVLWIPSVPSAEVETHHGH